MKTLIYSIITLLTFSTAWSQDIIQIDQGENYTQSVYLDLSDNEMTAVDYTTWDIAFANSARSASIYINEAVSSAEGSGAVALYLTSASELAEADTNLITDTLYNQEGPDADGAFNAPKDTTDNFDFGWGSYDIMTHNLNGTRVFIIKLRDGSFKKFKVNVFQTRNLKYTFSYSDLDGENAVTDSINLGDFEGKAFAFYSLADQKALDLEPENWDLQFTRYNFPVANPEAPGGYMNYLVTGVISRPGTEVAVASDIDPETVEFETYQDSLTTAPDAIGYEWKFFDLNTFQYSIVENEVYFVKTNDNEVYKLQFLDFEGASTGVSTLRSTLVEVLSALTTPPDYIRETRLYPNPATSASTVTLRFQSDQFKEVAHLGISNAMGQMMYSQKINVRQGENNLTLPHLITPGLYYVILRTVDGTMALPLINN